MFLNLLKKKKAFLAGRIVRGNLLRLTWKHVGSLCYYDFCHFLLNKS